MAVPRLPYPSARLQYSASAHASLSKLYDERDDGSVATLPTSGRASPTSSSFSSSDSRGSPLITRSCVGDLVGTPSSSRRFYRSLQLGQPPLGSNNASTRKPEKSSSTPSVAPNKTAPMKELQKMIADLKKENFDLKLRLYHLEAAMQKQVNIEMLEQENHRLALNLQEKNELIRALERALYREGKSARSVGTQTAYIDDAIPSPQSATTSYHTAFAASPEAFGLAPSGYHGRTSVKPEYFDEPLDQILDAFQSVHIVSPRPPRRNDDPGEGKVLGWLDQIVNDNSADDGDDDDDESDKDVSPLRDDQVYGLAFSQMLSCAKPRASQ